MISASRGGLENYYVRGPGIKIGYRCRIGAGVVLLPGVELGNGCIVGAGAVVTKGYYLGLVVGNPARSKLSHSLREHL